MRRFQPLAGDQGPHRPGGRQGVGEAQLTADLGRRDVEHLADLGSATRRRPGRRSPAPGSARSPPQSCRNRRDRDQCSPGELGVRCADDRAGLAGNRAPRSASGPAPLAGLRVLDLSRVLAGPLATMTLGDLGADVIKVERPGRRGRHAHWGPPFVGRGRRLLPVPQPEQALRGDRPRDDDGRRAHPRSRGVGRRRDRELPAGAHGRARAGPGRSSRRPTPGWSRARSPRSATTRRGPQSRPGYDIIVQALSGLMSVTGEPDGEPTKAGVALLDVITGLYATIGIQAALLERERTGRGTARERVAVRRERRRHGEPGGEPPDRRGDPAGDGLPAPEHRALPGVPRGRSPVHRGGGQRPAVRADLRGGRPPRVGARRAVRHERGPGPPSSDAGPAAWWTRSPSGPRRSGSTRSRRRACRARRSARWTRCSPRPRVRRWWRRSTTPSGAGRCGWCADPLAVRRAGVGEPACRRPPWASTTTTSPDRERGRPLEGGARTLGRSRRSSIDAAPESPWGFPRELFAGSRGAERPARTSHHANVGPRVGGAPRRRHPCSTSAWEAAPRRFRWRPGRHDHRRSTHSPTCSRLSRRTPRAAGVHATTVEGRWPEVAAQVVHADVAVSGHTLYNVADLEPFVSAPRRPRAASRGAGAHRPASTGLDGRPVADVPRAGHPRRASGGAGARGPAARSGSSPAVKTAPAATTTPPAAGSRRGKRPWPWCGHRLCLPADRDDEIAEALGARAALRNGRWSAGPAERTVVTLWWDRGPSLRQAPRADRTVGAPVTVGHGDVERRGGAHARRKPEPQRRQRLDQPATAPAHPPASGTCRRAGTGAHRP